MICAQRIVTISGGGRKKKVAIFLFLTANLNLSANHTFGSRVQISN